MAARSPKASPVTGRELVPTSAVATEIVAVRLMDVSRLRTVSSCHLSVGCLSIQYGLISSATSRGRRAPVARLRTETARSAGVLGRSTTVGATPSSTNAGDAGVRNELNAGSESLWATG